jgi:hypothetical protein
MSLSKQEPIDTNTATGANEVGRLLARYTRTSRLPPDRDAAGVRCSDGGEGDPGASYGL